MPVRPGSRAAEVLVGMGAMLLLCAAIVTVATGYGDAPIRFTIWLAGGALALAGAGLAWRDGGAAGAVAEAEARAAAAEERARDAGERERTAQRARVRAERARIIERDWNRELRDQLRRLFSERRSLTGDGDVRELVLHTAITLLEAEKGVMLAVGAGDGLEMVAAEGFDGDPLRSTTVRRLATRVDDRDQIVHDDDPDDPELANLVALPVFIADDFSGVVVCANREGGFAEHDDELLLALGSHAGAALDSARLQADLRSAYLGSIRMLAEAIEAKDASLRLHSEDVAACALAVGERLGLDGTAREHLLFGSLLHDVGKIGIAEQILTKPGGLTPEERRVVELHPRIGARLVEQVPALREIVPCVLHHHERYDGAGYPAGLAGEHIPIAARIVGVADAYSAMTAERPHQAAMEPAAACAELERCAGDQFDPEVVRLFVAEMRDHEQAGLAALPVALADPALAVGHPRALVGAEAAALIDPLTMLYSRRYLEDALATRVGDVAADADGSAVVLVELEALDEVNRTTGLAAGDDVLRTTAATVQSAAASAGGVACRFSGRRFAILLPGGATITAAVLARLELGLAGGPAARWAAAPWRPGDRPADLLARAAGGLG